MRIVILSSYAPSLINFRGDMIIEFVKQGNEVIAVAPEIGFEAQLGAVGAKYRSVNMNRTGLNPLQELSALWQLWRLLRELAPDVVFCYTIKPVIYGSLIAQVAGIARVYSMIAGLGYVFSNNSLKQKAIRLLVRPMYKLALRRNAKIFFQNPDDLQVFASLRILNHDEQAVLVNGSGVNIKRFPFTPPKTEPIVFLLVARLIWDKGIGEYVEAARVIKRAYPHVIIRILGPFDTNPSAISRSQIARWEQEGVIEYCGETGDVKPYLVDSSVVVLPSRYREGTPRSVLEAMAIGRAIITTDTPGCRETVVNGANGYLVPAGDSVALAKAMATFIANPHLIEQMGIKSREIAVEKYDVRRVNHVILKAMDMAK